MKGRTFGDTEFVIGHSGSTVPERSGVALSFCGRQLIRNIGREPELYRGLEMCLSRLQEKFKRVNDGERLFRSVRNRGYCLTQRIKNPLELAQQFR
ncbi:hypothetical protein HBO38_36320 [Pseudomonas veronii]|uniref:OmpR/PhoB-type domain-containing protein n=1 Tax=Pseudomonas veronii TaxID=76761 RepID=A0A7Y1FDC2_PSEVE|nr:hypothetical protein [Pseudomonas veronii]